MDGHLNPKHCAARSFVEKRLKRFSMAYILETILALKMSIAGYRSLSYEYSMFAP